MARLWTTVALLGLVGTIYADGMYSKTSPVLQVGAKNYDSLIAQSNHTSILEFYAPWCGHCQNLKPGYEKAAKNLAGLAKVAAINCDEDENKPFCGSMGIQGFPTLKIIKPGKKPGKPVVEDYQGPRTAKGIVDAVVGKIPNHIKKLEDAGLEAWLADPTTQAKAILFTDKGTVSGLIRALAVDFLGSVSVAQIRSKEEAAVAKYGITQFPSIVLLPGDGKDPIVYTDEMKKQPLVDLFSQVATPNPDPAPKKAKTPRSTKSAKDKKTSSSASAFSEASEAHKSADFEEFMAGSTIVLDDNTPTESPLPIVDNQEQPIAMPEVLPSIEILMSDEQLEQRCVGRKTGTCILVLLPVTPMTDAPLPETASEAMTSLGQIAAKHNKLQDNTFPFFALMGENQHTKTIRSDLGLKGDGEMEIIALNNKRGWWRHYTGETFDDTALEGFVDSIKLGETSKEKLPPGFGGFSNTADSSTEATPEPEAEPEAAAVPKETSTLEAEPEPAATAKSHDEL